MTSFVGIDTDICLGAAAYAWLARNTNVTWTGFYLPGAPSHSNQSYRGQRVMIRTAGLGLAAIYVGRQIEGPGQSIPAEIVDAQAAGTADGESCAATMKAEGFGPLSKVWLDVENDDPPPANQVAYIGAWAAAVAAGGYDPRVYHGHLIASEIAAIRPGLGEDGWVWRVPTLEPHPVEGTGFPAPAVTGCGVPTAAIWQRDDEAKIMIAGGAHLVDLDVATSADPSSA